MQNFCGFRGLASNREGFQRIFCFSITRCFELLYNRESFSTNNKIMQPRNFYTANNLHYTVKLMFSDKINYKHTKELKQIPVYICG